MSPKETKFLKNLILKFTRQQNKGKCYWILCPLLLIRNTCRTKERTIFSNQNKGWEGWQAEGKKACRATKKVAFKNESSFFFVWVCIFGTEEPGRTKLCCWWWHHRPQPLFHNLCFTGCKMCSFYVYLGVYRFFAMHRGSIAHKRSYLKTCIELHRNPISWPHTGRAFSHWTSGVEPRCRIVPEALITDWNCSSFRSNLLCLIFICICSVGRHTSCTQTVLLESCS